MDHTTIDGLRVSRLLLGSNPFSGFSHQGIARDEQMVRHYTVARIKQALFDREVISRQRIEAAQARRRRPFLHRGAANPVEWLPARAHSKRRR